MTLPHIPDIRRLLALATACLALAGCSLLSGPRQTPITEFYVLSATSDVAPTDGDLALGIGPVTLPAYLERPEMVTRVADNQVVFDEFNRWAEPLRSNFMHVLATDLDAQLGLRRVAFYPWYDNTKLDFAIGVALLRFERGSDGTAVLIARWNVRSPTGDVLLSRESQFRRPATDPSQTAAALSAMTAELAQEMAVAIRSLPQPH